MSIIGLAGRDGDAPVMRVRIAFACQTCNVNLTVCLPFADHDQFDSEADADPAVEDLARRHALACPICKQPAEYVAWSYEGRSRLTALIAALKQQPPLVPDVELSQATVDALLAQDD